MKTNDLILNELVCVTGPGSVTDVAGESSYQFPAWIALNVFQSETGRLTYQLN